MCVCVYACVVCVCVCVHVCGGGQEETWGSYPKP